MAGNPSVEHRAVRMNATSYSRHGINKLSAAAAAWRRGAPRRGARDPENRINSGERRRSRSRR